MNSKHRIILYLTLVIALYIGLVYITKLKNHKTQLELNSVKNNVQRTYKELAELVSLSISQILTLPQDDSIKALLKSRADFFLSRNDHFINLVEDDCYEEALYAMNQRTATFFEIINYAWEYIPALKNTPPILNTLERIGDLEFKVDSLLTKAEKIHKTEKFYRKLLKLLWPFANMSKIKTTKLKKANQKAIARIAPTISNNLLFLTFKLFALNTASSYTTLGVRDLVRKSIEGTIKRSSK